MSEPKIVPLTDEEIDRELAEIAKQRATAQARVEKAAKLQRLIDSKAIAALEASYGATNISVKEIPYFEGLPLLIAVRTPTPAMVKNYRAGVAEKEDGESDFYGPAEDLALQSLVYPAREVFEQMKAVRYGIGTQLGLAALKLATAREERRGKV